MHFNQLLRAIRAQPNHEQGRDFERVCQAFLAVAPAYKSLLARVWLWRDWPDAWGPDTGIDLVGEAHDGGLWAIQVKCFDPDRRTTKRDIDSFLAESARPGFSYRLLITTSRDLAPNARNSLHALGVGYLLYHDLDSAAVQWRPVDRGGPLPQRGRKTPRPHQEEALTAAVHGLAAHDRGRLVMACGTGKTLVGLWIHEALRSRRTLLLFPSLSLLAQTLAEWVLQARVPFRFLAVCSDETVVGSDAALASTAALGVPVTTDPGAIGHWLAGDGCSVVFATYQSSLRVSEALLADPTPLPFDLVLADEAHRCAGPVSGPYATVLDSRLIPATKRVFMTATPRYYTGRLKRRAMQDDFEIASMDDEATFGPVLHSLTFGEAIRRQLLCDFRIVLTVVSGADVWRQVSDRALVTRDGRTVEDAEELAGYIGLQKAMATYGLTRVVSFHSRVARARRFAETAPAIHRWLPTSDRPSGSLEAAYVSGKMSAGQRHRVLRAFHHEAPNTRQLVCNARCLSEGVDVPSIDGVAFVDPRRSQIDIVQATGRAIRLSKDKTVGTILVSLFVPDSDDHEHALSKSAFATIASVLQAMRAYDDVFAEQLDECRRQLGARPGEAPRLPDRIVLDLPAALVDGRFSAALKVATVRCGSDSWDEWLGLLRTYVAAEQRLPPNKDVRVAGFSLGTWVFYQRKLRNSGHLLAHRAAALETVPLWSWDPQADRHERCLSALSRYAARHGHSRPSRRRFEGLDLGTWVIGQRFKYRQGRLDPEFAARLEALPGWTWDPFADDWDAMWHQLRAFTERTGHARPSANYLDGAVRLGAWVTNQRQKRRRGDPSMTADRERRLEELSGWSWDGAAAEWEERYAILLRFVDREGHARVPLRHREDDLALGSWVANQRHAFNHTGPWSDSDVEFSLDRRVRLERLPRWSWDPYADDWKDRYQRLSAFVADYGTAAIGPKRTSADGFRAGSWVASQRNRFRAGKMPAEQAELLAKLPGWRW